MDFSLIDQFALVAQMEEYEFRTLVMYVCLCALGAFGAFGLVCAVVAGVKRYVDGIGRGTRIGALVSIVGAVVFLLYAGVSADYDFRFMPGSGIYDAGSWIDYETGEIHALWNFEPYVSFHKMKWFYTYKYGRVEKGPFELPEVDVSLCHAEYILPTAGELWESVVVTCYTEYVPHVHVVTNGTYHVYGIMRSMSQTNEDEYASADFITPGITVLATLGDGCELTLTPTNEPPESVLGELPNEINNNDNLEE